MTQEYRATAAALLEGERRAAAELRTAGGDEAFEQRVDELRRAIAAIDAGLLRRALFLARRPARGP